jgi:hypothetical protein
MQLGTAETAAYMGARRIGVIGVDLTDHHFFGATGRHSLAGRLREIDAQYGRLAAALEKRGVELVNLSSISRLTSLPRARVEEDGGWTIVAPAAAAPVGASGAAPRSLPPTRSAPMRVAIEKRSAGVVAQLLDALAATAARLGYGVSRDPRAAAHDPRVVSIVWNGRGHASRGPTLYCEHGWLPRSDYQISHRGINAGSHVAPFDWDGTPLSAEQDAALDAHLAAIRTASFAGYYQYMQADAEAASGLPPQFLLVPLQIESDTNIVRHAPGTLRTMQALVDYVAAVDPPWPVIFKQHPADVRRGDRHLRLRLRRPQDLLWPQARGNVHQMLKSGACRGILTINSNVAHDGLLWDVPAIVLGRNVWPSAGARLPFLTACPRDWSALHASATSAAGVACRRAYAHFLMRSQWTLADAGDRHRVAALLAGVRALTRPGAARAAGRAAAPVAPVAPPRPARRVARRAAPAAASARRGGGGGPTINVVAENRGWLFEAWKRRLAAASYPGFRVVASDRPLRQADAWIFVRAREAGTTPDPARTVVQVHDLGDDGRYAPGGERADVARCAGLSLTHPEQRELLAAAGIDLAARRWLVQPVGWSHPTELAAPAAEVPTVAWVGRAAKGGAAGAEPGGLAWFVEAVRELRSRPRVMLVGERVEPAAAALRRRGIDCRVPGPRACPLDRASAWLARVDCVVVGGGADSGPWPLFDAMYAGAAVVAPPVGWAARLLEDGACGRLVDGAAAMRAALEEVLAARDAWRERRALARARVADYAMSAWVESNLRLAAELAAGAVERVA